MAKFWKHIWQNFTIACCMNNRELVSRYGYNEILHMFDNEEV